MDYYCPEHIKSMFPDMQISKEAHKAFLEWVDTLPVNKACRVETPSEDGWHMWNYVGGKPKLRLTE